MIEQVLFWVFAILTCGGAVAVVATQNVVRMAFWLVVSLGSVSALFFLLDADFLGAAQLLIYVGGTVVLLVFGVMLTASGPYVQIKTSPAEAILGGGVGFLLLFVLVSSIGKVDWGDTSGRIPVMTPEGVDRARANRADEEFVNTKSTAAREALYASEQQGRTVRQIGISFLGLRPDRTSKSGQPLAPGYLLPFEIISIHLLVVLIGAAYLARAKRRYVPAETHELS